MDTPEQLTVPEARQAKIAELEEIRPKIIEIRGQIAEIEDALSDLQRQRAEAESTANNLAGQITILNMIMTAQTTAQMESEPGQE